MKFLYLALFVLLVHLEYLSAADPLLLASAKKAVSRNPADYLSFDYYLNTCPDAEGIIQQIVGAWIQKDFTLAPSLIRLHFHDCAVRGCDASILLNYKGSERTAYVSSTLRGFPVIDDIKKALEKRCPRTVSCADILTAAARDATVFAGGPFWQVPFGRKDGRISIDKEAEVVPQGHENVTTLINYFKAKGLDILDLVALSGAHTIGRATCGAFLNRVYNFNGTTKPDPSLNTSYLKLLKKRCQRSTDLVYLDVITPRTFDTVYYTNLQKKAGLLTTDQELYSDQRTAPFVEAMASQPFLFENQFLVSMVKLGNVEVLTRNQGEVRLDCSYVNSR
ncbi:peroxidase 7-like [Alnus glutinosa]|uniref:peroxidase 7-like n=1 Tax=Alnus glutinosa TaxID=3517 RepID=UPI002D77CD7E|nr:peroxidase 7-like [Alnus glutinosa]